MIGEEKKLLKCSGCAVFHNVVKLKPGAKFKCPKCGAMNTVPVRIHRCLGCHKETDPSEIAIIDGQPLCPACRAELAKIQQASGRNILAGVLGGGIAVIVAGIIWGVLVFFSKEIMDFMVVGVGVMVGWGVFLASGRKRSRLLQRIACAITILAILVGRYLTAYYLVNHSDAETTGNFALFSRNTLSFFYGIMLQGLSKGYDILFLALAIFMSYKMPAIGKPVGLNAKQKSG